MGERAFEQLGIVHERVTLDDFNSIPAPNGDVPAGLTRRAVALPASEVKRERVEWLEPGASRSGS